MATFQTGDYSPTSPSYKPTPGIPGDSADYPIILSSGPELSDDAEIANLDTATMTTPAAQSTAVIERRVRKARKGRRSGPTDDPPTRFWCVTVQCGTSTREEQMEWATTTLSLCVAANEVKMVVYQLERGEGHDGVQGNTHFQMYIEFKDNKRRGGVKKFFQQQLAVEGIHCERREGTRQEVLDEFRLIDHDRNVYVLQK